MSKMRKLAIAVLALLVVTLCGCQKNESVELSQTAPIFEDGAVVGEGETEFEFSVKYDDGKVDRCTVKTDKKTVGEALLEHTDFMLNRSTELLRILTKPEHTGRFT